MVKVLRYWMSSLYHDLQTSCKSTKTQERKELCGLLVEALSITNYKMKNENEKGEA
jgi:hypothetical protein